MRKCLQVDNNHKIAQTIISADILNTLIYLQQGRYMRYSILIICALCMTYAAPGEWVLLGDKKVSRFGKGTIKVFKNTVGFSGIKLRNSGGRLRLVSVVIHFSDRTKQKINFSLVRLRKNEETKLFNVNCQRRSISQVSVHYVTAILTKPPHLELWGWRRYERVVQKRPPQKKPHRPRDHYDPRDHDPGNDPQNDPYNNDPQNDPYNNDPQNENPQNMSSNALPEITIQSGPFGTMPDANSK